MRKGACFASTVTLVFRLAHLDDFTPFVFNGNKGYSFDSAHFKRPFVLKIELIQLRLSITDQRKSHAKGVILRSIAVLRREDENSSKNDSFCTDKHTRFGINFRFPVCYLGGKVFKNRF